MRFIKFLFIFILTCLLLWGIVFHPKEIGDFFSGIRLFVENTFSQTFNSSIISELETENKSLQFEINELKKTKSEINEYNFKIADVFSKYPFNNDGAIIINLGERDGIKTGMPVFVKNGILLGSVKKVNRTQSEVQTIFSPGWKTSVGVGEQKEKAVLNGGIVPFLELIPKDKNIKNGDNTINLSPEFPLNSYIGEIVELDTVPLDVWLKAKIKVPYSFQDIKSVLVMIDFP